MHYDGRYQPEYHYGDDHIHIPTIITFYCGNFPLVYTHKWSKPIIITIHSHNAVGKIGGC